MTYVSLIVGTSAFDTLACRPLEDVAAEPAIEKLTCNVSRVQVIFGDAGKFGHGAPAPLDERLSEPEEANRSVTEPPAPTESRRPFATSLNGPLTDSVGDGENAPTSTILVKCDGSSMPTTVHVADETAPV